MSILRDMVQQRRRRIELDEAGERQPYRPSAPRFEVLAERFLAELESQRSAAAAGTIRPIAAAAGAAHRTAGYAVIAEIKRRSPSKGELRPGLDPVSLALAYQQAGARAVSVLTEPDRFGGSFADLAAVRRAVSVAVLCKDIVVDPRQIEQARACGADLLLLMVAVLGTETERFVSLTRSAGMEPLVEVHTGPELDIALAAGARLVGVNNRDLCTLRVDLDVCRSLLPRVPPEIHTVAESGIETGKDLEDLTSHGARAFLVGEALVTAQDPGAALRRLARGRTSAREEPSPAPEIEALPDRETATDRGAAPEIEPAPNWNRS